MKTSVDLFKKRKHEYWKKSTTKHRKGEILNMVCEVTGMHRKAVIRKFKKLQFTDMGAKTSMPTVLGRPRIYDDRVVSALMHRQNCNYCAASVLQD